MDESSFLLLRDLISRASGIHFDHTARATLERRLRPRIEALQLDSFEQYYLYLSFGGERQDELQRALDSVAIHETYFFREERALRAFSEEMLPEIAARNRGARAVRIWSAGCSTGEEAYTLAMLIVESRLFDGWRVDLFASDLSQRVVTEAQRGHYAERSFRAMEAARRPVYFTPQADGSFSIAEELRAMVNFGCFNLVESRRFDIYSDLDVIFCRNVMIYFGNQARRQTVEDFHRQLRPGGYLILGASESLFSLNAPFRLAHLRNDLVYQK